MATDWIQVLQYSFQALWVEVLTYLPQIVIALIVLIVGWLLGGALKHLIERLFASFKINDLLNSTGVNDLVKRTGHELRAGAFVGSLVKWFVIIVFLVTALDVLNLPEVNAFFREVVLEYLPRVIVAVLILLGALVLANVTDTSITAGARAAGFGTPEILGRFARYAIIVFAVLASLSQVRIAPELVQILFTGFVFAASLALGLAFGLGGRDAAGRYIERVTKGRSGSDRL